jgi:chromatin structure-remodeling complex subunit SFH1
MDRPRRSARASNAPQLGYPAPAFTTQPPPPTRIPSSTSSSRQGITSSAGGAGGGPGAGGMSSSNSFVPNNGSTYSNGINGAHPSGSSYFYGTPPLGPSMGASTPPMGSRNNLASFPISKTSAPVPPQVRVGPGQARHTTFASRARQGISTLMQPLPVGPDLHDPLKMASTSIGMDYGTTERTRGGVTRRRAAAGMTYYGEEGSDFEDDDEAEANGAASPSKADTPSAEEEEEKAGALLGMPPPGNKVIAKRAHRVHPLYAAEGDLIEQADRKEFLIPIKIELETDTHRIKDVFTWNMREYIVKPKDFARVFVRDLELPSEPFTNLVEQAILAQIQLAEQSGIDLVDIGPASGGPFASRKEDKRKKDSRSWNWGIKRKRDKVRDELAAGSPEDKWDTEGAHGEFEDDMRVIIDVSVCR